MAQLTRNLENACIKARRHGLVAKKIIIYLRTQSFTDDAVEAKITRATNFPNDLISHVRALFADIYKLQTPYRATGIVLADLQNESSIQSSLFESVIEVEKMHRVYAAIDSLDSQFGKHTVHLGGSQATFTRAQYAGDRTRETGRELLHGETARQHLNIPRIMMTI